MKFGVGQPVPRTEDPTLLRGEGRYTDDVNLADQVYAVMVRSKIAHGVLKGIDTKAASAMPGVLAILTHADLEAAGFGPLKCPMNIPQRDGSPMKTPPRPSLAKGKVRFVGEAVACVVAGTAVQAKDAAEAVELDIEELPAVTTPADALKEGAPQIHAEAPGNLALDFHYGDAEAVKKAFADAAHVTRLEIISNRIIVNPMEPRSAIGSYDPKTERFTLQVGCQGVMGMRGGLARDVLGLPTDKVRVLTGNVGGSFGMKGSPFPEYAGLFHASKLLGRPVKWTDERSGSFLSDQHGRDHDFDAELALDKDGRFLAVRLTGYANVGGYLANVGPLMGSMGVTRNLAAIYRTPLIEVATKVAFTHTSPIGAYRGAGRPEANYFMERLIDTASREMGIDSVEMRRRNHIRPEEMPYKTASGTTYDSGEFTTLLDKALKFADVAGFAARKAESKARGKLRGIGIGDYLEVTAPPMKEMGGIRFEPNGDVTIITGTLDYGQGHWSAFAQVLIEKLGIPFHRIKLIQGDSDLLIAGGGTGGSKSIMASGAAIVEASDKVIDKGKQIAGVALEASAADIEFKLGRFTIVGTDRGIGIMELAERLRGGMKLPEGVPATLDVSHVHEAAPSAFPNGAHVAEVEIDPDTGWVEVVKYTMVNDFGTVINPLLVEGQSHGGVVQGIGQALFENCVYDDASGQLLSGSFMDYCMPRADNLPRMMIATHSTPCTHTPMGVKGCGEVGTIGSPAAVANAVVDALAHLGVNHVDMPATANRVWRVMKSASLLQATE
jgi:carbon-monoxide dehydrogenase large subunit